MNGTIKDTLPFAVILAGVSYLFPLHTLPMLIAGLLQAYILEEWIHHSVHFCNFKGRYFQYIKRHHLYHHSPRGSHVGFGLTNGFWDIVWRTRIPEERASGPLPEHGIAGAMNEEPSLSDVIYRWHQIMFRLDEMDEMVTIGLTEDEAGSIDEERSALAGELKQVEAQLGAASRRTAATRATRTIAPTHVRAPDGRRGRSDSLGAAVHVAGAACRHRWVMDYARIAEAFEPLQEQLDHNY